MTFNNCDTCKYCKVVISDHYNEIDHRSKNKTLYKDILLQCKLKCDEKNTINYNCKRYTNAKEVEYVYYG